MLVFLGFASIKGETKALYFDKETLAYKVLVTTTKKIKDKNTKEEYEAYVDMSWKVVGTEDIKVVGMDMLDSTSYVVCRRRG